jgi:hypothetical protein
VEKVFVCRPLNGNNPKKCNCGKYAITKADRDDKCKGEKTKILAIRQINKVVEILKRKPM